jgi:hypothetical protein
LKGITLGGIVLRFAFAFALVCLTWNPSPANYSRWALNHWQEMGPFVLFSGLIMLIGWAIFLRATARSLGWVGAVLATAVAGSILWMIIDFGLIDPNNGQVLGWVLLTLFSAILAVGMSWSHLRRRWSGQVDIDDVDDRDD